MELEIEKNVKDKNLYKFDEEESKEKKEYRHKKAIEDIDRRLKEWHKYVGLDINNPVESISMNVVLNTLETLKNILIKKGIMTEGTYNDMYWVTADHSLQILEVDKDKIKENVRNQKTAAILRGNLMGPKVIRN